MSIPHSRILTAGGGYLFDRLQSAGPGSIDIPEEKIDELGNEESVEKVRDTPNLTFDLESYDVTPEFEAAVCRLDPATVAVPIDLRDAFPMDIVGAHKNDDREGAFGIATPFLDLTTATWRFGVEQNATQTFQLNGDSYFPGPGTPIREEFDVDDLGLGVGPYPFGTPPAVPTELRGTDEFALSITVLRADGGVTRLALGADFTSTATEFVLDEAPPAGSTLVVSYFTSDLQTYLQAIHPTATMKPGAVKGKDIFLYIGPQGGPLTRWRGVQQVEVTWSRQSTAEKELGNPYRVANDKQTPEVGMQVTLMPPDLAYLYARIAEVTDTPLDKIANLLNKSMLEGRVEVCHPQTGALLKRWDVPDLTMQAPPLQARVNQKLTPVFRGSSDGGNLDILSPAAVAALTSS